MRKSISVSKNIFKDIKRLKHLSSDRERDIENAQLCGEFRDLVSSKANNLHPGLLELVITGTRPMIELSAVEYTLSSIDSKPLPFFRAGQYICIKISIDGSTVSRPYSICSSPGEALCGIYRICVQEFEGSFVASWILRNWTSGMHIVASSPEGSFYYQRYRDCSNVVAVAGGCGITPFMSMAGAILEGSEDFGLTILRCSKTKDERFYPAELDSICRQTNRVRVVDILENDYVIGGENGRISARYVIKYAPSDVYSVFACGPTGMYAALRKELTSIGIPDRLVRFCPQAPERPSDSGRVFDITFVYGPYSFKVPGNSSESLLCAAERAGITAPSGCRSGECGWCLSRLVSGKVSCRAFHDRRRWTDKEFGYIHPCCCFPLSDCTIELPVL